MNTKKAQAKNVLAIFALAMVLVAAGLLNRYGKTYVEDAVAPYSEQAP